MWRRATRYVDGARRPSGGQRVGRHLRLPLRAAVIAGAVVVVGGLTACGAGAPQVQARTWAGTFCRSFVGYEHAIDGLGARLDSGLRTTPSTDLTARRQALVGYLTAVVTRTDGLSHAVTNGGTPDMPHGSEFVVYVEDGFHQFRQTVAIAGHRAARLPARDPVAFSTAISRITATIQAGSQQSRATIVHARSRYGTRQLDHALTGTPACQAIA